MPDRNRAKRVPNPTDGPWTRWKGSSRHGKAIRFIEAYCRSPKGYGFGKPITLAAWQKAELERILADDIDAAVESFPRGNGKSTLMAGLGVWSVFADTETGFPDVPIIATTVGQAMRSVYDTVGAMVAAEPELADRSITFTGWGSAHVEVPSTGGKIYPVANEHRQLQGLNYSLALVDEIGFQPLSAWADILQAGGKRPRSLALGMGTPGTDHDNALYQIREALREGPIPRFYYREWAAPEGCSVHDRDAWRAGSPAIGAGFLRESALETDLRLMPEARFRIFRLGQWVEGFDSWLGEDGKATWDALRSPHKLVPGAPTWVGVDAAITRDTTAVVAVQYRSDGRLHARARFWTPKRDEPTDLNDVMAYLRELADTYRVGGVAYDPRFMDWPAKLLHDEGIPMVEISQGVERMTPIVGDLYTLIREGGLSHDDDPLLAKHILDAVARPNERGFTLKKAGSRGHIDGAIALALAVDRARNRKKPKPTLYVG
jgi:phage terminase large subunit-like protein